MADREFQDFNMPPTRSIKKQAQFAFTFGPFEILMLVAMGIFLTLLVVIVCYLRKMKYRYLLKSEITEFFRGGHADASLIEKATGDVNGPYDESSYEVPKNCFEIDETALLGSGAFGKVCRGTLKRMEGDIKTVAVKMTKVPCPRTALRGLLFEIKILSFLGKHPHIVELKGAYTTELKKGRAFVFLELCTLGSLQGYLRELRASVTRRLLRDTEAFAMEDEFQRDLAEGEFDQSLVTDLLRWASEIANGMEYIASKYIVHLDLATRNVLLTGDKRAKITDFGLSRRLYDYQTYIKKEQEPLPWRWMAPESLRRSEFTEKSDVWAFGVTMWEIFELGNEPYPGLSYDVNFPTKLERGLRLGEPTYNCNSIYSLMLHCWTTNPKGRPAFTEISNTLCQALTQVQDPAHHMSGDLEGSSYDKQSSNGSETAGYIDTLEIPVDQLSKFEALSTSSQIPQQPSQENVKTVNIPSPTFFDRFNKRLSGLAWLIAASLFLLITQAILILLLFGNQKGAVVDMGTAEQERLYGTWKATATNDTFFVGPAADIKHLVENKSDIKLLHSFLCQLADRRNISANEFKDVVKYLIFKNLSNLFNIRENSFGRTPLMIAAKNVELDMTTISLLKRNGVDVSLVDETGSSYISYAADGNKNMKLLIELNKNGHIKHSKLIPAIQDMDADSVKVLVWLGADVNQKNSVSETPIHLAAKSMNKAFAINIIKFLIHSGASVYAKAQNDTIFLHKLVAEGGTIKPKQFHEIATFLISKGRARLFNIPSGHGVTPFIFAVYMVEMEISTLSLLKNNGVDFNATDYSKQSVLYWASLGNRSTAMISGLVKLGANPNQLSILNISILHVAAVKCNVELVKFFLDLGLDINALNKWGQTPLHYVFFKEVNVFRTVQLLLRSGAKSDIVDHSGRSPRDFFFFYGDRYPDVNRISTCFLRGPSC